MAWGTVKAQAIAKNRQEGAQEVANKIHTKAFNNWCLTQARQPAQLQAPGAGEQPSVRVLSEMFDMDSLKAASELENKKAAAATKSKLTSTFEFLQSHRLTEMEAAIRKQEQLSLRLKEEHQAINAAKEMQVFRAQQQRLQELVLSNQEVQQRLADQKFQKEYEDAQRLFRNAMGPPPKPQPQPQPQPPQPAHTGLSAGIDALRLAADVSMREPGQPDMSSLLQPEPRGRLVNHFDMPPSHRRSAFDESGMNAPDELEKRPPPRERSRGREVDGYGVEDAKVAHSDSSDEEEEEENEEDEL